MQVLGQLHGVHIIWPVRTTAVSQVRPLLVDEETSTDRAHLLQQVSTTFNQYYVVQVVPTVRVTISEGTFGTLGQSLRIRLL